MEEEIDSYEEEEADLELEEQEEAPQKPKKKMTKKVVEDETPKERYVAFVQKPVVGVMDTVTKEIVLDKNPIIEEKYLEELIDEANYRALILNKLDRISIVTGTA